MKIAFLGDSITHGVHGCSYIKILEEINPKYEFTNYGKGGDTIVSLFKRVQDIDDLAEYDIVFLFVGVNDVLGRLSLFYSLIKTLQKQPCSKTVTSFESYYGKTLKYLQERTRKLVVLPPLFIGEDINNKWNKKITERVTVISSLVTSNSDVDFIDIRREFREYLQDKKISTYLPLKASEMKQDGIDIRSGKNVDLISESRKLHLTIDGVHINTLGASLIANSIQDYLNHYKR